MKQRSFNYMITESVIRMYHFKVRSVCCLNDTLEISETGL